MTSLLLFTDASPNEFAAGGDAGAWHSVGGIGILLPRSPAASGLVVSTIDGGCRSLALPDPNALVAAMASDGQTVFRQWKDIRRARRDKAVTALLASCAAGRCFFLSHSSRGDLLRNVIDRYRGLLVGHTLFPSIKDGRGGYIVRERTFAGEHFVTEQRMIALIWLMRAVSVFIKKIDEATILSDCVVVHDQLPFNQEGDARVVQTLLTAGNTIPIYFRTDRGLFDFAPADNLAGAVNAEVSGRSSTIQSWLFKNKRPKNFYSTADTDSGGFVLMLDSP